MIPPEHKFIDPETWNNIIELNLYIKMLDNGT